MFIENAESLRSWLTSVLQPLCDADPAALAKYVLALIKKDRPDQELKQCMIDQLDVFLQQETRGFVDLLFRTLANKSYLNDGGSSAPAAAVASTTAVEAEEKKLSSPKAGAACCDTESHHHQSSGKSNNNVIASDENSSSTSTLVVTPSPLAPPSVNLYHSPATTTTTTSTTAPLETSPPVKLESKLVKRESRKDEEKERDTTRHRKSRSPRRSPSRNHDRRVRSRSPRDRDNRDRDQYPHRSRHRVRKSPPPRRYEREGWERRRSDRRSPNRNNRSVSPRGRSRTPPRYRRNYHSRSRSRSRSPANNKERSRSPVSRGEKVEKKEQQPAPTTSMDTEMSTTTNEPSDSKTHLQSVVRAVNHGDNKLDKVGYTSTLGGSSDRCRDFDEKGLCMRGELCPFDHGKDPVVLEDISVSPRGATGDFIGVSGSNNVYAPQILRPTAMPIIGTPSMEPPLWMGGVPPPFRPRHMGGMRHRGPIVRPPPIGFPMMPQRELISIPVTGGQCGGDQMMDIRGPPPPVHHMPGMHHRMRGGLGRGGRGRGGFDHGRLGMKPARNYANCSLEVKKIPRELNNIMDLNSHFSKFGKIVNIQINFENDAEAALITFSSPHEANQAYRSTEAVLNNRFIRVFWHNKEKENEEGEASSDGSLRVSVKDRLGVSESGDDKVEQEKILVSGNNLTKTVYNPGLLAKKAETASDKLQACEAVKKSQEALSNFEQQKKVKEESQRNARKLMVDLRKRKQDMLHEQIEQQKKLIAKLELCKNKPEKDGLMSLIKSLQESIETIKKDLDSSSKPPQPPQASSLLPPRKTKEEVTGVTQKEILDAELDLINKEQEGGDTNELQRKVLELRAQAQVRGLLARGGGLGGLGGRGGLSCFRGMGRGFTSVIRRGRGGGKRFRLLRKVDRRPTTICVTGFPAIKLKEVLAQFATYGPVAYYDADPLVPSLTITYESRKKSEIAYANGKMFENTILNIDWVTPTSAGADKKNLDAVKNGESSIQDEDNNGSLEEEEMNDMYTDELLLQYEDEEEEDDERSWRR